MDWRPFIVCEPEAQPPRMRGLRTPEGLGDRMRTAAFAEYQAIRAFTWAVARFDDVPEGLRADWAAQIPEEAAHYEAIKARMEALGLALDARPVSDRLSRALMASTDGRDFCIHMARSEARGRQAGLRLAAQLSQRDPQTAAVFLRIAEDEIRHVALADRYYGWRPELGVE
ncbi:ferritin-like domain-containing protein [Myxococcota bacterium]|nr:ferritin-like domain-containing protein [Myxococcota bacterium]MBU1429356.1 ferritin-like domain-containing protein [Myxococcota bacterium]MBU1899586.1 ferritin-like domain-containing protein [Myxococcota bacterium]